VVTFTIPIEGTPPTLAPEEPAGEAAAAVRP
jgi:hypothetical protein